MRKLFLCLALPVLMLTACGSNNSAVVPSSEREKVQLTTSNYEKYIAVITICDPYATYNSPVVYYRFNFEGSDLCKFIDCNLKYKFMDESGNVEDKEFTVNLNLSGDGQTVETLGHGYSGSYTKYFLKITDANGTVEILY